MFIKRFAVIGLLSLALIAGATLVPLGGKVGDEVYFDNEFVGNLPEDQVRKIVSDKIAEFENQKLQIGRNNTTPVDLGITYSLDRTVANLLKQKSTLIASLIKADSTGLDVVQGEVVVPVIEYNYGEVRMRVAALLEEYETESVDAAVVWTKDGFEITESKVGRTIVGKEKLVDEIVAKLTEDVLDLGVEKNYPVQYLAVSPVVNTEQANAVFAKLNQYLVDLPKVSVAGELNQIDFLASDDWFEFDYLNGEISLNKAKLEEYVKELALELNQNANIVTVKDIKAYTSEYYGNNIYYKADVEGEMKSGKSVNEAKLIKDILAAFEGEEKTVYVEFDLKPMEIRSTVDGANFSDLLSVGKSSYALGNQPNRVHNIKTAVSYQNGVVIPPGARFSFNDVGGWVTLEKGYQNGKVIMGSGVVDAPGGGVCQVSTTAFRAAVFAGLDIDKRKNHSWDVSYYQDIHGVDAAVYPPGEVDLAFYNTTPGYILVHAFVNEPEETVYFEFYGESDGRSVELSEPWLSRPVGGKIVKTDWQIKKADGTVEQREIVSRYWK